MPGFGPQEFSQRFAVSHETLEKLQIYRRLLIQWQDAVNLVAPATLDAIWLRHFADSAQLLLHAPKNAKTWIDLGSGAGFPGLVIAIMIANQSGSCVHLVESNGRKCSFLSEVAQHTGAAITVHNARIADFASSGEVTAAEVVTARALAPLGRLFELSQPFLRAGASALFLKGREAEKEIAAARKAWTFEVQMYPSISEVDGRVLKIEKLMLKRGGEL